MKKVINHALVKQKISLKTLVIIIKNSLFVKNIENIPQKIPKNLLVATQLPLL